MVKRGLILGANPKCQLVVESLVLVNWQLPNMRDFEIKKAILQP
jgi:hypothetical protein